MLGPVPHQKVSAGCLLTSSFKWGTRQLTAWGYHGAAAPQTHLPAKSELQASFSLGPCPGLFQRENLSRRPRPLWIKNMESWFMDGCLHFYTTCPAMRLEGAMFISLSPRGNITRGAVPGPSRRPAVVAVVESLSCVRLFAIPWTAARQASPSFTISQGRPAMGLENLFPR